MCPKFDQIQTRAFGFEQVLTDFLDSGEAWSGRFHVCQQTLVHNLLCNLNGAGLLLLKQVPKGSLGPDQVSIFAGCDQELVYALWFHAMLTVSLRFHTLWVDFLGSDQVLAGSVGRDQVWALVFDQVWMDFPGSDKVLPGRNPV